MLMKCCSYAALGLMHRLNPSSSGGVEVDPRHLSSRSTIESASPMTGVPPALPHAPLRKGFGRIIRDEAGNIVDVEMADDEDDDSANVPSAAPGVDAEEWASIGAESAWVKTLSRPTGDDADVGVVPGVCAAMGRGRVEADDDPICRTRAVGGL
jgi:hypothetical protein